MRRSSRVWGVFDNTMAYVKVGEGLKTLLFVPGGPGNTLARGPMRRLGLPAMRPFVESGFTVWEVTRPRNMPAGHSIADMADDYAALIRDEFGGRVDLALGSSMGGMILQYLAAHHPDCAEAFVVLAAGCEVSEASKDLVTRQARAMASGDRIALGMVMGEELFPGERNRRLRRLLAPLLTRLWALMMSPEQNPHFSHDFAIEADAAVRFDSRADLAKIGVPVLLIGGDKDLDFPKAVIEETARLIPDCTLVWYPGQDHGQACRNPRTTSVILDHLTSGRLTHNRTP